MVGINYRAPEQPVLDALIKAMETLRQHENVVAKIAAIDALKADENAFTITAKGRDPHDFEFEASFDVPAHAAMRALGEQRAVLLREKAALDEKIADIKRRMEVPDPVHSTLKEMAGNTTAPTFDPLDRPQITPRERGHLVLHDICKVGPVDGAIVKVALIDSLSGNIRTDKVLARWFFDHGGKVGSRIGYSADGAPYLS